MSILILEETLKYLRFNCIWPQKDKELNPSKLFYIKFVLMLASTSVILIGSSFHLVVSLQNNSNNIGEDLVIITGEVGVYYFISSFVSYQKEIAKIYKELSDFDKFGKPQHFDERNKKLVFWSKVYRAYIDIAVSNICLGPFFAKKFCERQNKTREFQEICGLLVTTWLPFDIEVFPIKQILYVWQCYTILFTMKGAAVISFALTESMEHLVVRIQHLKLLLTVAARTKDDGIRKMRFSTCINYHNDIFDIAQRIDVCYSKCLFLHVLLSGALFGCIGYKIMESFSFISVSIFLGWVLSLYIVCISGQHLMDESLSVAQAAYDSDWSDQNFAFQNSMILVVLRSQKPILVHAGPFSYVSHVIMVTIFKTAYTYLTLLNATSV